MPTVPGRDPTGAMITILGLIAGVAGGWALFCFTPANLLCKRCRASLGTTRTVPPIPGRLRPGRNAVGGLEFPDLPRRGRPRPPRGEIKFGDIKIKRPDGSIDIIPGELLNR